jgi:hypothetical protein
LANLAKARAAQRSGQKKTQAEAVRLPASRSRETALANLAKANAALASRRKKTRAEAVRLPASRSRETALANLAKAHAARTNGHVRAKTQAEVVAIIRKKVETKLKQEPKGTLGDYIRLVQLQKELEGDEPKDITVTWVEPVAEPQVEPSE